MQAKLQRAGVVAVAVGLLVLLAWLGYRHLMREGEVPAEVIQAERALALPDLIAMAGIDVGRTAALLRDVEPSGIDLEATLLPEALRGIGLDRQTSRALVAISGSEDAPRTAAVLFGEFEVASIEAAIRKAAPLGLHESAHAGEAVLSVITRDPETCAEEPRWGIALRRDRLVLGEAAALPALLAQLATQTPTLDGPAWLDRFQPFRDGKLAAAVFPVPPAVPTGIDHPVLRAMFRAAGNALGDVTHLQIGARAGGLTGAIDLEIELTPREAARATGIVERWRGLQETARAEWRAVAPRLADWHEALEIETDGETVRGRTRRSSDAFRDLAELTSEWMILASRDFHPAGPQGTLPEGSDAVDPWPQVFFEALPVTMLRPYRSETPLAGKVDAIAGPFGIRVERVTPAASPESGLEITLRAAGREIPNLVEPDQAPRLLVTQATDAEGANLLRDEPCGPDPNPAPALLLRERLAKLRVGLKTLRLRPGVPLEAVERLEGRVEIDLPVRTQSLEIQNPRTGQEESVAGATVEVTSATSTGFSYRLRGEIGRVLAVRGLSTRGQPLASLEAWETDLPSAAGRVGMRRYAGKLDSIETIIATEVTSVPYAFTLDSARPGSDGESLNTESAAFIQFSREQYEREFGGLEGPAWPQRREARALTGAGPFTVALEELTPGEAIVPRLTVLAPKIPNLSYNVTGLELTVDAVGLRNPSTPGTAPRRHPARSERTLLAAGHRFGRTDLESNVLLDTGVAHDGHDLAHIDGHLVLRLPHAVRALELPAEPGRSVSAGDITVTLTELVRDGFGLRVDGPPDLFSVQAFGAESRELDVERGSQPVNAASSAAGLRFRVHGRPERIRVQVTGGQSTARYAFRIELPEEAPAAPAR